MRIHVVALDGLFDTGLAAIRDAFALANKFAKRMAFEVTIVGVKHG